MNLASVYAVTIVLLWVLASRLEQLDLARRQAASYAAQAGTDQLTGLANRRRLDDELDRQIGLARRHGQPLSIAIVDLDHFKRVNDEFGHDIGDATLVEVGTRFRDAIREGDLVGRWGGEEFLVIAPYADQAAALEVAERCRARCGRTPFPTVGHLTASFGVATLALDDDRRALQRRADLALYAAKTDGRDRVVGLPDPTDPRDLRRTTGPNGRHR